MSKWANVPDLVRGEIISLRDRMDKVESMLGLYKMPPAQRRVLNMDPPPDERDSLVDEYTNMVLALDELLKEMELTASTSSSLHTGIILAHFHDKLVSILKEANNE